MIENNEKQIHSDDEVLEFSRVDGEPVRFGTGWISGVVGILLSGIGLLVVLCVRFPSIFTMSTLREYYPIPMVRALLYLVITSGFLFGLLSLVLRRKKILGCIAVCSALISGLLGGSQIQLPTAIEEVSPQSPMLSVDWFVLNLMFWCALFIPLERWFALRAQQPIFRHGWRTDLSYFFASTLAVQWVAIFTMKPAQILFSWVIDESWRMAIANQPIALQIIEILLITDFVQYWIHRAFHRIPFLWKFHAVHHSAERMDWLAGSRLHIVDILATRGCTYVPLFVLGFADVALLGYGVIVTLQATFVHANLRFTFGPLRYFLVTPQFHHWHHSDQSEAIDKNFAIHLPIWDWLFGSYHLPEHRWPDHYGVQGDKPPEGFFKHSRGVSPGYVEFRLWRKRQTTQLPSNVADFSEISFRHPKPPSLKSAASKTLVDDFGEIIYVVERFVRTAYARGDGQYRLRQHCLEATARLAQVPPSH